MQKNQTRKVYIIAEAGVNHNGSLKRAKDLINIAKNAGADCIKFQAFDSSKLSTKKNKLAPYQKKKTKFKNQIEMLNQYQLSNLQFFKLLKYAKIKKIDFLCSPFDLTSIDLLCSLNIKTFKIPSGEITNYPYLRYLGKKNKMVILSTGMSNISEIKQALTLLTKSGTSKKNITLLHCTSDYPANFKELNLNAIQALKEKFKLNVGYSDHSRGFEASCAAVALGASVIEKHITTNNNLPGPDHKASLNFKNFEIFVNKIRNVELSLGKKNKFASASEKINLKYVRKSIVAKKNIKKGEIFSEKNLDTKRPGTGLSPMKWKQILGKTAKRNFNKDELITL